jgi:hypothetical protein
MTLDEDPQVTVALYARTMIIPVEIAMLNVDFAPAKTSSRHTSAAA